MGGGQLVVGIVAVVQGDADLLEVVGAGHAVGRLAHLLHGGNQQADQYGDDGDNHEQFNQRETTPIPPGEETNHEIPPWEKETKKEYHYLSWQSFDR